MISNMKAVMLFEDHKRLRETAYAFTGIDQLIEDFWADAARL